MNTRSWLIALLLVALVARLGWCLARPVDEAAMFRSLPDQREYLELGRNILMGEGLWFQDQRFNQRILSFRTPGYPLLIAACGGNVRAIQIAQCVLDTSTVLAVFLLASRWMPARASLAAGFVVALNPFLVFFCSLILTETLFIALLTWGIVLLALGANHSTAGRRPSDRSACRRLWWPALTAGLFVLALSAVVRPSAILLPIALGCAAAALAGYRFRRTLHVACAAVVMTGIVLVPWAIRNRMVLNEWVWTSTNAGFTFYDGFNPNADGSSNQSFAVAMPELLAQNETERSRYLTEQSLCWIREHPLESIALAGRKLVRTWSPMPLSSEYGGRSLYRAVAIAYAAPFFVLVFIGLCTRPLPPAAKTFLLLPAIYFSVSHAVSVGSLRYRIPAEPPLAILAAAAVSGALPTGRRPDDRTESAEN